MLTDLDAELFPDDCEVVEIPSHSQWVYMIQKNGTTSIRLEKKALTRILVNNEIRDLNFVDIYVRDFQERYLSGINSFVHYALRDYSGLDRHTLLWAASRFLFLNRHYLPQILWVINLSRYVRPDTVLRLHDFLDFGQLVSIDHDAGIPRMSEYDKEFLLKSSPGIELWKFADQILKELAGRQMTWTELKQHYKINHPDVWNNIVGHAKKFQHVLS